MQIADVIHSWPCHKFSVDCSYNFDLMANVAREIYLLVKIENVPAFTIVDS